MKITLQKLLIVGGLIGLFFSGLITVEKLHLVQDSSYVPPCSINPIISCGSVMKTWQASLFGFPNSLIGIAGFAMMLTMGVALAAGASFKRWFWVSAQAGMTAAIIFVYWLFYQSVYHIGALCLYCMAVWTVTIPMFWYLTIHNLREGNISLPSGSRGAVVFMQTYHLVILVALYAVIAASILIHFWSYWSTLV